ncbi:scp-like extracellular protein [Seiridium cupressi]
MRISFSSLVQYSLFLILPLAEAKKCTKSRLSSARTLKKCYFLLFLLLHHHLHLCFSNLTVSGSTTSSSTTVSATSTVGPVVTNQAYIDTIIRHHNAHRTNHSAAAVVWSSSLADTARIIASSCVYRHNTTVNGGGYGQSIGAGFAATAMGQFVTEALYNGEVNAYTYYGGEPDVSTVGQWGHFSQIVWKGTSSVGCYTYDCSSAGLQNAIGIPPEFTVCNYAPAGNVLGSFDANVSPGLGEPTIYADYECPSRANCAN